MSLSRRGRLRFRVCQSQSVKFLDWLAKFWFLCVIFFINFRIDMVYMYENKFISFYNPSN